MTASPPGEGAIAQVAVPAPLPTALSYKIPPGLSSAIVPGVRVVVPLGRRRLRGVVVGRSDEAPAGVRLRAIEEVLDLQPILTADLLELATFTASYYLEPIGEVIRAMVPSDLPPWGDRRVWLTDAGALTPPKNDAEAALVVALQESGRTTLAKLQKLVARRDFGETLAVLEESGRVAVEARRKAGGARYLNAVELPGGDLESQLAAVGRSPKGRAVVSHLHTLGRPATVEEVTAAVGCTASVVRRLFKSGLLRQFTQVERIDLDRHFLASEEHPPLVLRPDQAAAADVLRPAVEEHTFAAFLLAGMTGSGKTEVYLQAADAAVESGRTVLLLVPEIALVPALARTVRQRYGDRVAILHSNLGTAERHQEWERIRSGAARVVLGPRSALFAPVENLGLVVVDEEQDPAYKQDSSPRYSGRDLALVRARRARAVALLASATPSLESRYNVGVEKVRRLDLTARAGHGTLPEGVLVDLREEGRRRPGEVTFSPRLCDEIEHSLAHDEQVVLLRNRRGYSPMLLCRACGEDLRCEQCGLPRTYHRRDAFLQCHYCGSRRRSPEACPTCDEPALEPIGAGTERVEEDFKARFPGIAVDVLDRDTVRRPGGAAAVLERFGRGETQVLIGTQMVSKGHHFPRVGLSAVLSADTYLGFPDFRAVERTYNLLVQVAGRAGRGERPGRVVIQTYHPEHYAIRAALEHDDEAFAREEMSFRRAFHYPPFTRMIQLLAQDKDRDRAEGALRAVARQIFAHPEARQLRISGPAPAPLERLKDRWRFQLLARAKHGKVLRRVVREALREAPNAELTVDVDPLQLL
ncbi:MAG: primosomal protein N' [Acidobacteriota bacterium]